MTVWEAKKSIIMYIFIWHVYYDVCVYYIVTIRSILEHVTKSTALNLYTPHMLTNPEGLHQLGFAVCSIPFGGVGCY